MKKLVLMRHGKSSWEFNVRDEKRPLKSRGKRDAELVALEFLKNSEIPHKIFSSPAKRTLDTCKIFTKCVGTPIENVKVIDELYDFGGSSVINFIKNLPDTVEYAMLFGHNHAFTSICNVYGSKSIDNLPTSGLAILEFDIDLWTQLKKGKTKTIITPKSLR